MSTKHKCPFCGHVRKGKECNTHTFALDVDLDSLRSGDVPTRQARVSIKNTVVLPAIAAGAVGAAAWMAGGTLGPDVGTVAGSVGFGASFWKLAANARPRFERRVPVRKGTFEHMVKIPFAVSSITAILIAAGALASGLQVNAAIGASIGTFGALWAYTANRAERLLWDVEVITGIDIDHDGYIGTPPTANHVPEESELSPVVHKPLQIELTDLRDGQWTRKFINFDNPDAVQWTAKRFAVGEPVTERDCVTRCAASPWRDVGEFNVFRDVLIERGLAYWRNAANERLGWELTAAGRTVMKRLAT